jgi:acetyl esterase
MARERLHPKALSMLEEMERADRPDASQVPIADARENLEALFADLGPGPDVAERRALTLDGHLRARLLRGHGTREGGPLIVYYHGGGHSQGSIDTHDALCRGLANACHAVVLNVDYRLAPEHPFPAAYEDALAAARWARAHLADHRCGTLVVAGDSAGGNLAAALAATVAAELDLAAQLLVYPLVSFARQRDLYDQACDDFFLNYAELEYFQANYVPDGSDLSDPRLSPLEASSLAGAPPAVIVAGGCDPLRPQAEAIHERLRAEGIPCELLIYPGMIHGFFGMTTLFEDAEAAFRDVARTLASVVAQPTAT